MLQLVSGKLDDLAQPGTILIFENQAKKLGVKVGDALTISAPTTRGTNNTIDVRVVAIAHSLGLLSNWNAFVPIESLRTLYQLNRDTTGVVQIMLDRKDLDKIPAIAGRLRQSLEQAGYRVMEPDPRAFWMKFESVNREDWTGQKLDVTNWEDEISFMTWTLKALQGLSVVLIVILVAIIVIGIMNTMWIAIRERTREIGTLRAIGMHRRGVLGMFMLESFMLGLMSTVVGAAAGAGIAAALNAAHIPVPSGLQFFLLSPRLHIAVHGSLLVQAVVTITVGHRAGRAVPVVPRRAAAAGRRHVPLRLSEMHMNMTNTKRWLFAVAAAAAVINAVPGPLPARQASAALTQAQMVELLKVVDDRQRNNGDWRANAYLEQKETDKVDVVYETEYYRRSSDQKFMILFLKPKTSAGQGYLRIDKNLWFYDPSVGKWERRTERERIGGTNSRAVRLRRIAAGRGVRRHRRGRGEAGRVHGGQAAAQGQAGAGPGVPDDPHLDRQGHQERPQAAGVRAVGAPAAHVVLPEVEEGPQRIQGQRRLVPAGDPLLRRGREGEPDADPDQGGRPEAAAREPVHEGLAREQEPVMRGLGLCALARWRGPAPRGRRQAARAPASRTSSARRRSPRHRPRPRTSRPPAAAPAPLPAPPPLAPGSTEPPAAAAETPGQAAPSPAGTARDQDVLGAAGDEAKHLSDYQAPDNPLQIGGQLYLRAQTSALQGQTPDQWRLSAPSLVDVFFDARPNPRVRAFILGRMSYDPTAPPGDMVTANSMDMMGR